MVIERTLDPTTWLIITGWTATARERIARARGERPGEVVAELLRAADSQVA